jgi:tetratricopeptide (TPR) repeat protein
MVAVGCATAQPKKLSKKEYDAFMAIQNETNPDQRIAKIDDFLAKFADTELKSRALQMAAEAAEMKGDTVKALVYAQNSLEADPKSFEAMLLISGELARGTRENDLDKEEKLTRAEKLAKDAMMLINEAPKTNTSISDEVWSNYKKDELSQAHVDLGMIALARKKMDVAIAEFKLAVDGAATPDPIAMVRLAAAYDQAGKPDEALPILEKVIAMPNVNPSIKQFAQAEQKRAEAAKAKK